MSLELHGNKGLEGFCCCSTTNSLPVPENVDWHFKNAPWDIHQRKTRVAGIRKTLTWSTKTTQEYFSVKQNCKQEVTHQSLSVTKCLKWFWCNNFFYLWMPFLLLQLQQQATVVKQARHTHTKKINSTVFFSTTVLVLDRLYLKEQSEEKI